MKKLFSSGNIYVARSKIQKAGRGVFAGAAIKKGELIERCPVIEILGHDVANLNDSNLATYIYYLGKHKERLMLALGFGSIYNHSYQPNAAYKENYKEKLIDFIAIKSIKKDEEITVNYSQGNQKDSSPLWFTVTK